MHVSVGIPEIDQQHRRILELLESMLHSAEAREDWYRRYEQMLELKSASDLHFEVEESLMRIHGYPSGGHHAQEHSDYARLIDELLVRGVSKPLGLGGVEFLIDWWARHIPQHDQPYADWFARVPRAAVTVPAEARTFGLAATASGGPTSRSC